MYKVITIIACSLILPSCATTELKLGSQKQKPKICKKFDKVDIKKDIDLTKVLSDKYPDARELGFAFDEYYNDSHERKLAVFLDGTNNDREKPTNIWVLYTLAVAQACNDKPIIPYYDKGVGAKWFESPLADAFANGVSLNIRQAYRFLSNTFKTSSESNPTGDKIYIFGFSRGAFEARSLNGFIEHAGLLDRANSRNNIPVWLQWSTSAEMAVSNIYSKYHEHIKDSENLKSIIKDEKENYEYIFNDVTVTAIGVFDTVPSVGLDLKDNPDDHKLELYANRGYHALALDEQRKEFKLLRFDQKINQNQVLKEVWFAGAHSNVGGGYDFKIDCSNDKKDEKDEKNYYRGIEATPLKWMLEQFQDDELFASVTNFQECPNGYINDEYFEEQLFGLGYKTISVTKPRETRYNDCIHSSVFTRINSQLAQPNPHHEPIGKYIPINLFYPAESYYRIDSRGQDETGLINKLRDCK